jgi:hypothetical protein
MVIAIAEWQSPLLKQHCNTGQTLIFVVLLCIQLWFSVTEWLSLQERSNLKIELLLV